MRQDGWIDELLERKKGEIEALGAQAFRDFGKDGKTQLSNLEQVALHADSFAEVELFVKRQVGLAKDKEKPKEKEKPKWRTFGGPLLRFLQDLREEALRHGDGRDALRVLLERRVPERLLGTACRWIHSEYLYRLEKARTSAGRTR